MYYFVCCWSCFISHILNIWISIFDIWPHIYLETNIFYKWDFEFSEAVDLKHTIFSVYSRWIRCFFSLNNGDQISDIEEYSVGENYTTPKYQVQNYHRYLHQTSPFITHWHHQGGGHLPWFYFIFFLNSSKHEWYRGGKCQNDFLKYLSYPPFIWKIYFPS